MWGRPCSGDRVRKDISISAGNVRASTRPATEPASRKRLWRVHRARGQRPIEQPEPDVGPPLPREPFGSQSIEVGPTRRNWLGVLQVPPRARRTRAGSRGAPGRRRSRYIIVGYAASDDGMIGAYRAPPTTLASGSSGLD